jgi:hypothetical protein
MSLPVPIETMTKWIQNWVHYDNLATAHNRQAINSRKLRDEYESHIINSLKGTTHENMIIQINSGRLQIMNEKHTQPLTLGKLQEILHNYFVKYHPTGVDETNNIVKFIRENKGYITSKRLKKTTNKDPPGSGSTVGSVPGNLLQ